MVAVFTMEHRVKQRSKEWVQLRQTVTLTASQFADAVGVGKGRPFHFFQSLVQSQSEELPMEVDLDQGENEKEMMEHGIQMESVIKEAYELLTGSRVLESGFWTPKEGHSMEGLIGASPDGLVVSEKDEGRVLGLVEFKAPVHKLYDQSADTRHGIPRHYMVQVQGQMAVCGAPWCDFMAVCSKTKDIMLKRVYFLPRYWEHIASRLKQFCFALQEADIMRELKREVFSGAMTQRIKSLPMQDKLFPAEDIITVENLLSRSPLQLYRGPSQKLLSYQILIGDTYVLPATLSRYKQDLLAKVDVEILRLKGSYPARDRAEIDNEEMGQVLQRVFSEGPRSPYIVSSATVFREGSAIREKENVKASANKTPSVTPNKTPSVTPNKTPSVTPNKTPSVTPNKTPSAMANKTPSVTPNKTPSAMANKTPSVTPNKTPSVMANKTPSAMPSKDVKTSTGSSSSSSGFRKAGSVTAPVTPGGQSAPVTSVVPSSAPAAQSHPPRPKTDVPQFRKLSRMNTGPRQMGQHRPATAHHQPRGVGHTQPTVRPGHAPTVRPGHAPTVRPGHAPRAAAPGRASRAAWNTHAAAAAAVQRNVNRGGHVRNTAPKPSPKSPALPRVSASSPRASFSGTRMAVAKTSVTTAGSRPVDSKSSSSSLSTVSSASSTAVHSARSASSTASPRQTGGRPALRKPPVNARQEWEMSAMKKAPESRDQTNRGAALNVAEKSQQKEDRRSQDDSMQWQAQVPSSGSSFLPPGLTLLSSPSTSSTPPQALDMKAASSGRQSTHQHMATISDQHTGREAHKRLSTSAPEADPSKRPLIDKAPGMQLQGEERDRHQSPERLPIHRPWQSQSQEGGRGEPSGGLERQPAFGREAAEVGHSRPPDLGAHPRHSEDRGGGRIPTILGRDRDDAQSRGFDFDFDHHDCMGAEDFQRAAAAAGRKRGQHGLRANPMTVATQLESMRHTPLDLSERHHHQDRDLFPNIRPPMLGREAGLGLDRGAMDSGGWRGGQFSRQLPPQLRPQWPLQARPDRPSLRNPLHSSWPRGQGHPMEGQHALDLQPQLRDRRFPDLEGRDHPRMDFRGDLLRGQFPRNFPRRPFDY